MDQRGAGFRDPVDFARFEVDGMAKYRAFADQPLGFVCIQVVAGLGVQILHPGDFVGLFAEVGLHQAIGVGAPERAQGGELFRRRGRRKPRRDGIGRAAPAVPAVDQRLAVVIGRLRRVAQPSGALRSMQVLPVTMRCPRVAAASNRASTLWGWMVQ